MNDSISLLTGLIFRKALLSDCLGLRSVNFIYITPAAICLLPFRVDGQHQQSIDRTDISLLPSNPAS
ncbi:MAG TPA: hypothetical protein PLG98_10780, partial [Smithella sp.]|nr:hypothetical protein [Smithella sp.]